MNTAQVLPSYRDTRAENALQNIVITIFRSNQYIETPFPIRCMGCGYTFMETNNMPELVVVGKIEAKDAKRSSDHRCKKCKITYRII